MQEKRKVIAILSVDDAKAKECNIGTIDYLASIIDTATDEPHDEKSIELDDAWICDEDDPEDGVDGHIVVYSETNSGKWSFKIYINIDNAEAERDRLLNTHEATTAFVAPTKIRI